MPCKKLIRIETCHVAVLLGVLISLTVKIKYLLKQWGRGGMLPVVAGTGAD